MKEITYYLFWYTKEEKDSFEKMISKKEFDDFIGYSKMIPMKYLFYKTFLVSKWENDK